MKEHKTETPLKIGKSIKLLQQVVLGKPVGCGVGEVRPRLWFGLSLCLHQIVFTAFSKTTAKP